MSSDKAFETPCLELTEEQKYMITSFAVHDLKLHHCMSIYLKEFLDSYLCSDQEHKKVLTGKDIYFHIAYKALSFQEKLEKAGVLNSEQAIKYKRSKASKEGCATIDLIL